MSAVLQAHPPPRRPGLTLAGCQFGPCPTTDEASHVASSLIFHACRHQYPGGSRPVLLRLASRSTIGLPLNSGGSAPATNVSRPAQCLLTLRPAWSLNCSCSPSHQSASVHVVASINRPGCYQPEPQLLRGVRTRQREAPYHGARNYTLTGTAAGEAGWYAVWHLNGVSGESTKPALLQLNIEDTRQWCWIIICGMLQKR